jgi:prolyl oligopeptidase
MIKQYFKFKFYKNFVLFLVLGIFTSCDRISHISDSKYPVLDSNAAVIDTYFGKKVIDKYRIIENLDNKVVKQWLQNEKLFSDSVLSSISNKTKFQKEVENILFSSNVKGDVPRTANNRIFFIRSYIKEGFQKLFYTDNLNSNEIELFSTQSINKDNFTYTIDYYNPSDDGKYLALGISKNGDENTIINVIDVEKKLILPDRIEKAMGGNPNWIMGKSAFFYQQFKEIKTDKDLKTKYEDTAVKLHVIGTDSKNDKTIFSRINNPNLEIDKIDFCLVYTFPKSDKVLAAVNHGSQAYTALYYSTMSDILNHLNKGKATWKKLCSFEDKVTKYALEKDELFLLTYASNSNGILENRNLQKPTQKKIILKGDREVLDDIIQTQDALYIKTMRNGVNELKKINLKNLSIKDIKLPYQGSIDLKPSWEVTPSYLNSKDLFFGLTSWSKEWAVYYYNSNTEKVIKTDIRPQSIYGYNPDLIVNEVEVPSHDGVMIPLSIIYSKNTNLNGQNPTLLYGYGAYGISINSSFNSGLLPWFKKGGIYAIAHVRGGGEKGDAWYKAGFKATKYNSWKDFIACAEYLIKNKYTSVDKLAAEGVSAGSISVGRAITERPDLFKAVIISVGIPNTIRLEQTFNSSNITEFGTTKDSTEFNYLYDMDTYHHIKKEIQYPSILFTAGINDARVEIWQPAKAVALIQEYCSRQDNIILFKIHDNGHFGDENYAKELTDKYSFLLWKLGHPAFN